jgi:hypothetical protein
MPAVTRKRPGSNHRILDIRVRVMRCRWSYPMILRVLDR